VTAEFQEKWDFLDQHESFHPVTDTSTETDTDTDTGTGTGTGTGGYLVTLIASFKLRLNSHVV
jgi:hypothetical protein